MRVMAYNSKHHITLQENKRRFEKYGNTFHNRIINTPLIATCEPENIKTMLSLRFKDYSFEHRQAGLGPLLGHGIFNAQGERWANSRQLLRPNFARDQVADLDAFERHFKLMMKHIPRDGTTVDLQDLFFMLTIDSATEFLFNHSTNTLRMAGNDDAHNEDVIFSKAFNFAQFDITKRMRLGPLDRFRSNEEGERAIKICHEYIDKFVEDALRFRKELDGEKKAGGEAKDEKYYFIQEVAKQTTDKKRIREELINILLAGRDTTASLLSNMFFELARRPEIWAKLREEVESLGGERPSYEQLRGLKYLKWCLNECKCLSCQPGWAMGWGKGECRAIQRLTQHQPYAPIPSCPTTPGSQPATQSSRAAAAQTAKHPSSSPRAPSWATPFTRCTGAKTCMGPTRTSTTPSGGPHCARAGNICPSTADRESA
ncbi:hypothetical protein IAQ61_008651 [Plenodomus lingam]|uniref:uncharacterized protein n=1 Tax=Leptosphaeria maculans TaxID=5022 RepID=UPI003318BC0E|nr:hypothetical protein IAQ61_008651 [Plenodomus lingam]